MAVEFDDAKQYAVGVTGATLNSDTAIRFRWSELVLASFRSAGLLNDMIDDVAPPTDTTVPWLDKNTDPGVMKYFDTATGSWTPVTREWLMGVRPEAVAAQEYEYIATEGQTAFTGTDENGNVMVFPAENVANVSRNGAFVGFSTSGTDTVTLDRAAYLGDEVRILTYGKPSVVAIENPALFYTTRDDMVAAKAAGATWTDGQVITVGQISGGQSLKFVAQTGATAFSDLLGFLPGGIATLAHWGVEGIDRGNGLYPATATVDDGATIQAAMTWCLARARDLHGDQSKVYGTSIPICWGARSEAEVIPFGNTVTATLRYCIFQAIAGDDWTTGDLSAADPKDWTFGSPVLYVGKDHTGGSKYAIASANVTVDGARIAAGGIEYLGSADVTHERNYALRCNEFQQKIGKDANKYSCTDTSFIACKGHEWSFGDDLGTGFDDISLRSAVGLAVYGSDSICTDCSFHTSKHAIVLGPLANFSAIGGMYWNGQIRTDTNSKTVVVSSETVRYNFTGTRFDDGQVRIYGFHGGFTGCFFTQFQFNQLRLVATAADETADLLRFVGNSMSNDINGDNAQLEVEGDGTWARFKGMIAGNQRNDGSPFCIDNLSARLSEEIAVIGDGAFAGSIAIGRGMATGGGDVALIGRTADTVVITPTNGAGDFTYTSQLIGGATGWTIEGQFATPTIPTYADNAAAVSGGLAVGKQYKTAAGAVRIVV